MQIHCQEIRESQPRILVAGQSLRLDIFGDVTQGDGREGQFQVRYPGEALEFLHVDPLPGLNGAESIVLVF
ncbi:TPA: hypothetical protein DCE37_00970 [Candidatus Latescibacteria bacterium]|nr:hypothetical protein [Candidatus Latescibacterota bacterium]|tara:strand:- start:502 stop:714 length:213 start_codon:yes stop_codon:yes gene_type:complete